MLLSFFGATIRSRKREPKRFRRRLELETLETRELLTGTWTPLTNLVPDASGGQSLMLMTDGTVLVQGGADNASKNWYKLTPNASGSYINGTFTTLTSAGLERLFFASNVLPSGKVFTLGGEYSGRATTNNWINTGEIYDPVANSWSPITNFPNSQFGDDPTIVLNNGLVLAGYLSGGATYLYNPANNTWTATGTKLRNDRSDEETWVMLPDNSILSFDVFNAGHAQRYLPATGTWVDAGTVPVTLSNSALGFELGPAELLPDGRVMQIGANSNTAIYTPSTNTWVAGPVIPNAKGCDDAPGAMLPNGHMLFAADTFSPLFTAPTQMFDFDPVANTIVQEATPAALTTILNSKPAFLERMLVLPNGDVLMADAAKQLWEYTPTGSADPAWQPTISSITTTDHVTFTLTGTQLNGLSEGASYGDDAEMSSNYPIVQLKNAGGSVFYARTFNWTSQVATGSTPVTTQFTLPAGLPTGSYNLTVIANGIASTPITFATLAVTSSTPANGASVATRPTSFSLTFNEPVANPGSVAASVLKVNGLSATGVSFDGTATVATFTYAASPVTAQGVQTMSLAANTLTGFDSSNNLAFASTFYYDALPLAVAGTTPALNGTFSLPGSSFTYDVTFNEPVDPATVGIGNLILSQGSVVSAVVQPGNQTVRYTLTGLTTKGNLTIQLAANTVKDQFDNPTVTPFTGSYLILGGIVPLPTPLGGQSPFGSLIYSSSASDTVLVPGDLDRFSLAADPGQTLTILVTPNSAVGLTPSIQLRDPSNAVLGSASAGGPNQNALLQTVATTTSGTYTVTISGLNSTLGGFTIQVFLDAAVEAAGQGIGSDNSPATAQSLNSSFVTLQTSQASGSRGAVLGSVGQAIVNATASGSWDSFGNHSATNSTYLAGQAPTLQYRNFFVFNLGNVSAPILSAQLNLSNASNGYSSPLASDTYSLFDVSTSTTALQASGVGQSAIFADLGSGVGYGSQSVASRNNGQIISTTLNAAGVAALNSSRGGTAALGGALTSLVSGGTQLLFGSGNSTSDTRQLVLTLADARYYSFTLTAGERATAALKYLSGGGETLTLQDGGGTTLATGVAGVANVDAAISGFTAPTAGTYYLVVSGSSAATYSLIVTRDATFDLESHSTIATAQNLTGAQGVLGAVTAPRTIQVGVQLSSVNPSFSTNLVAQLNHDSLFNFRAVAVSDAQINTLAQLVSYDVIVLGDYGTPISATTAAALNAWVQTGQGGLVASAWLNTNLDYYSSADTRAALAPILPINVNTAGNWSSSYDTRITNSVHPVTQGVTSFTAGGNGEAPNGGGVSGATVLAVDASGRPAVAVAQPGSGRSVWLNADYEYSNTELSLLSSADRLLQQAIAWAAPPVFTTDVYQITLSGAQTTLQLETSTPLAGPNQILNTLAPNLQLYNAANTLLAGGTLLADGRNQTLTATSLTPGASYYVKITAAGNTKGEYFLGVKPLVGGTIAPSVTNSDPAGPTNPVTSQLPQTPAVPQLAANGVVLDDGGVQRSVIRSLTLTFQGDLVPTLGQLSLKKMVDGAYTKTIGLILGNTAKVNGGTQLTFTFSDSSIIGKSLSDGAYQLSSQGTILTTFFRLFGDVNGDNRVDSSDQTAFTAARNSMRGSAAYRAYFDYFNLGRITLLDALAFQFRFNKKLDANGNLVAIY